MMKRVLSRWGIASLLVSVSALPACADPSPAEPIRPKNMAAPPVAEDMVTLPGSDWVLVSAISIGDDAQPGLFAVKKQPLHIEKLSFQLHGLEKGGVCDAPLTADLFSPLGIAVIEGDAKTEVLAINRGGRHAVERFQLESQGGKPQLVWRDCIPLPKEVSANSVSGLANGDIYVTQSYDPGNKQSWQQRVDAQPTGQLFRWRPGQGWQAAEVARLSGPNGLVLSADGCYAVVAAWSSRELVRQSLPCESGELSGDAKLSLNFMPDNLRWTSAGTVLATGQQTTPEGLLDCVKGKGGCPEVLSVVEIDPTSMTLVREWHVDAGSDLGLATTALQVADEIWVSSILGHRIARFPFAAEVD